MLTEEESGKAFRAETAGGREQLLLKVIPLKTSLLSHSVQSVPNPGTNRGAVPNQSGPKNHPFWSILWWLNFGELNQGYSPAR